MAAMPAFHKLEDAHLVARVERVALDERSKLFARQTLQAPSAGRCLEQLDRVCVYEGERRIAQRRQFEAIGRTVDGQAVVRVQMGAQMSGNGVREALELPVMRQREHVECVFQEVIAVADVAELDLAGVDVAERLTNHVRAHRARHVVGQRQLEHRRRRMPLEKLSVFGCLFSSCLLFSFAVAYLLASLPKVLAA